MDCQRTQKHDSKDMNNGVGLPEGVEGAGWRGAKGEKLGGL